MVSHGPAFLATVRKAQSFVILPKGQLIGVTGKMPDMF
jgi:hypothetical protein